MGTPYRFVQEYFLESENRAKLSCFGVSVNTHTHTQLFNATGSLRHSAPSVNEDFSIENSCELPDYFRKTYRVYRSWPITTTRFSRDLSQTSYTCKPYSYPSPSTILILHFHRQGVPSHIQLFCSLHLLKINLIPLNRTETR